MAELWWATKKYLRGRRYRPDYLRMARRADRKHHVVRKTFPGGKMVLLEENYRSTKNILAAANEVIAKNIYRREKNLFTKNIDGEPLGDLPSV
jgi:ATP-dependent exoDNAse (exonuclease V) beta subunit